MKRVAIGAALCVACIAGCSLLIEDQGDAGSEGTIWVDVNSLSSLEDGSEQHPFKSIRAALDAAADFDVIHVSDGVYEETVTIDRPVIVEGEFSTFVRNRSPWIIASEDVEIRGLRIYGGAIGPVATGTAPAPDEETP